MRKSENNRSYIKLAAVNADTEISSGITSRVFSETSADHFGLDENNLPVYRDVTIKQMATGVIK